jgi:hypothetical protein
MRAGLFKWLFRGVLTMVAAMVMLVAPVGYTHVMCRTPALPIAAQSLLPPADHRKESRTLLTVPEWHIVHAYEDYAKVIETKDPHDFEYLASITQFWTSLCKMTKAASHIGEIDRETLQMDYVIGVSFTAELLAKAVYEESIGRLVAYLRGPTRSQVDGLAARQAADYAAFLHQVPW